MRAAGFFTLPLGLGLLVSGCLAEPAPTAATTDQVPSPFHPEWAERAVEAGAGHNHRDPSQHQDRSTPNFQVVGYNPLITDYHGKTAAGHLCGDVAEKNDRRLAVIHSWVSDVAVIIVDVTDPTRPEKIGELALPNTHVYDLGISPDQRWVLLATTEGGLGPDPSADLPRAYFEDACTGERSPLSGPENEVPYQNGVVLVDVSNPRAPKVADYLFLAGGHSMQVEELKGRTYALVTTFTFSLIEVVDGRLVPLTILVGCTDLPICSYHDGALQTHPVTKQNLAYLAAGSALDVFSIENPRQPRHVGRWNDWASVGSAITPSFLHEALPMDDLWEGRHYTFIGEECGGRQSKTPSCLAVLLDTTDPAHPTYVGAWTVPVETGSWGRLLFSLHYLAVSQRTLFAANYHGGLWAVDVSTPDAMRAMPTIGVFVPSKVSPKPVGRATSYDYTPAVLDANPLSDGTLVVYDHTSGLYTVRFDASNPAPAPPPWPLSE